MPRPLPRTAPAWGRLSLILGVALLLVLAVLPAPYVIREPGPTFNALGELDDHDIISVQDARTYPTGDGELRVMTVNVVGNPTSEPTWFDVLGAWITRGKDVLPVEAYYPDVAAVQRVNAENVQMMTQAQDTAVAAALRELDYEVGEEMRVADVTSDGASNGLLQQGDIIDTIGGKPVTNSQDVANLGLTPQPTPVVVERDGKRVTVSVTPRETSMPDGSSRALLGVTLQFSYVFPVDIAINLGDVGGPSAGMMFALAVYDKLTDGELTGGEDVAGTGTISDTGEVGPIGGIRQKLYAAADAGADYFIAPETNCAEAVDGPIPGGLPVYATASLDESLRILEANAHGQAPSLRTCAEVVASGGGK